MGLRDLFRRPGKPVVSEPGPADGGGSTTHTQDAWDELVRTYPPGTVVSGEVVASAPFGVFVRLDILPDVTALLEVIHFESFHPTNRKDHPLYFPNDYPPIGSRLEARVLAWSERPKDVRLTQLPHLYWTQTQWLAEQGDPEN